MLDYKLACILQNAHLKFRSCVSVRQNKKLKNAELSVPYLRVYALAYVNFEAEEMKDPLTDTDFKIVESIVESFSEKDKCSTTLHFLNILVNHRKFFV